MSNYCEWARRELELCGAFDDQDDYGGMLGEAVMELVEVFSRQGHSGMSAAAVSAIFHRLSRWKPLSPITDEPEQWINVSHYGVETMKYQHKRCSSVFKDANGRSYDDEARVFENQDGTRYMSRESRQEITFPYTVPDKPAVVKMSAGEENAAMQPQRETHANPQI